MNKNEEIMKYLTESQFVIDELGRVVIEDPAILSEINGAFGLGEAFNDTLANAGCVNGACH